MTGPMYLYTARVLERDSEAGTFYDVTGNQATKDGTDLTEIQIIETMIAWISRDYGVPTERLVIGHFTYVEDPEERNPTS